MLLLLYIVDVNVNIFEKMFNVMLIALIICIKSVLKPIIVHVVTYDMS